MVVAHAHFQPIEIIFHLSEIMSKKGSIFEILRQSLFQKVLDVHIFDQILSEDRSQY